MGVVAKEATGSRGCARVAREAKRRSKATSELEYKVDDGEGRRRKEEHTATRRRRTRTRTRWWLRRRKEDEEEEKEKVAVVPDEEEEDAARIERVGWKEEEGTHGMYVCIYAEVRGRERRSSSRRRRRRWRRRARGRKASGGTSNESDREGRAWLRETNTR